ncbi:hypothetical protein Sango_0058000 [Sesamum angolense]|uniref:Uncharacterized protein n=1 Tax=Sesamum angolense TaxID=2727404 RepID=A0AAE2C5X0_9LAMI|nr:hypothetical protein Sango_0058000 [Sesamum angolense]
MNYRNEEIEILKITILFRQILSALLMLLWDLKLMRAYTIVVVPSCVKLWYGKVLRSYNLFNLYEKLVVLVFSTWYFFDFAQLYAEVHQTQPKQSKFINIQMLQRQIMFKQLQELQRRQQLQDLGDTRNQNYVNQLPSLRQASGGQFPPAINGTPVQDSSQMFMVFQGPSNLSVDLLTKNNNSPLGMAAMQPFMSQQCNFSSDQIGIPGDSLQPNQEKNLFGQVPIGGFNSGVLSGSYTPQGIKMQRDESLLESDGRHEDAGWNGLSPGKTSNLSLSQNTASLDPLEQKILYNTDDNSWESSFSRNSKMSTGGFEKTSSSDTGIQEEWSGLSFQNPEPLNDNQPPNFIDSEKLQNNWVDRNLQNATSPSSKPDHFIQNNNMNCSFPNFQQSGHQYLKQKEEYHSESSHATTQQSPGNTSQLTDYNSQQRSSTGTGVNQLNVRRYSVEPENMAPGKNVEAMSTLLGASSDRHGESTIAPSESMLELLNKDDDQTHAMQLNSRVSIPRDLPLTETTVASFAKPCNTSPLSPDFGFRLGPVDPGTPKSYSFFPPLSTGNSRATAVSSHNLNDYIKNQQPPPPAPSHMATEFPAYSAASSQENPELKITHSNGPEFPLLEHESVTQPSLTSDMLQHAGFPIGLPTPWQDMATQQHAASTKSYKFSSNLFRSPDSASSSLGAGPGAANEQSNENCFQHEFNVQEMGTHSGKSECSEQQQDRGSTEMHDSILPLIANARELLMSGKAGVKDRAKGDLNAVSQLGAFQSGGNNRWNFSQEAQGDQSGKTLSTAYHQNLQQIDMFCQNDMQSRPVGSNIPSNMTYQSQVSLQMAPSWFKHYGTLKNGQMLSMYDPKLAVSAAKAFPEMSRNLQENNPIMQVNLGSAGQGSGLCPTAATSVACKQLNSTCMLPSDVTPQNLAVSIPKKRKLLTFDMVPWHKELNHGPPRLQDISTSELVWAQVSNRRPEEVMWVKDEAETFEEFFPAVRAKRRLICTTQLMQQVFQPGPAVILWSDASSNCDYVAYSAARLALGDACRLTSQLPSHTNDTSPDEPNSSKRIRSCEFSKVVECFINRVKKLEGDLSKCGRCIMLAKECQNMHQIYTECCMIVVWSFRLDKSLSVVDVKVEAQDLEKFSIINRFAKYHIRAQPSTVDPASSSNTSILHKAIPQKYVSAFPMPKIVPDGTDCVSL